MSLWERVKEKNCASLAVCGLAKNTGKTVTLNHLIGAAAKEERRAGLSSIGRDGEKWDVLSLKPKPAIRVRAGMLVATAEKTLPAATAKLKVLERTNIRTALGRVVLARVRQEGNVELAGPSRVNEMRRIIARLHALGADPVLVDGAFDRQSFAAPRVTQGFVLTTGAALGESLEEVVRITRARVRQFALPVASSGFLPLCQSGRVVVIGSETRRTYPSSVFHRLGVEFWKTFDEPVSSVVFGGALLNGTVADLLLSGIRLAGMKLVIRDTTCLFVEEALLARFLERNGSLEVLEPMQLLAVTVNPTSPEGPGHDSRLFFDAISAALPGVPVYDLVKGFCPPSR